MSKKFKSFEPVLVRDREDRIWRCDFYSHYIEDPCSEFHHSCISGDFKFCIPYKENEHLIGTCESPKKKEKFEFGDKVSVSDFKSAVYRKGIFVEYKDENSKYVVLSECSHRINEWRYCRKGWDDKDE